MPGQPVSRGRVASGTPMTPGVRKEVLPRSYLIGWLMPEKLAVPPKRFGVLVRADEQTLSRWSRQRTSSEIGYSRSSEHQERSGLQVERHVSCADLELDAVPGIDWMPRRVRAAEAALKFRRTVAAGN